MSLYVEWVNHIKAKATSDWLTKGQRVVFESVLTKWQAHAFVCIYGPAGCGKSFIARLLHKEEDYFYANDLKDAEPGCEQVVLDSNEYTRAMRPMAASLGIKRLIVLMRQAPRETMPKAAVVLDEEDVQQFRRNLYTHKIIPSFVLSSDDTNFDRLLQKEAMERMVP